MYTIIMVDAWDPREHIFLGAQCGIHFAVVQFVLGALPRSARRCWTLLHELLVACGYCAFITLAAALEIDWVCDEGKPQVQQGGRLPIFIMKR